MKQSTKSESETAEHDGHQEEKTNAPRHHRAGHHVMDDDTHESSLQAPCRIDISQKSLEDQSQSSSTICSRLSNMKQEDCMARAKLDAAASQSNNIRREPEPYITEIQLDDDRNAQLQAHKDFVSDKLTKTTTIGQVSNPSSSVSSTNLKRSATNSESSTGSSQYPGAVAVGGIQREGNTYSSYDSLEESNANTDIEDQRDEHAVGEPRNIPIAAELVNEADLQLAEVVQNDEELERKHKARLRFYTFGFILLVIFIGLIVGLVIYFTKPQPEPSPAVLPIPSTWIQVGEDIDGIRPGDRAGSSVSLSSSGDIIVVGATGAKTGKPGRAHIYIREGKPSKVRWKKIGKKLVGRASYGEDRFGHAVSISGSVVAIAARYSNNETGSVYIYDLETSWNTSTNKWVPVHVLHGKTVGDRFGSSIALSGDGDTLAVGASQFNISTRSGYVTIYHRDESLATNNWNQIGKTLRGQLTGDEFGDSVALSYDGSVLIVGASQYHTGKGYAQIFRFSSNDWNEFGNNNILSGENDNDEFGSAVAISSNGEVIAISAPNHDGIHGNKPNTGSVTAYRFETNKNIWGQMGNSIDGEDEGDQSGRFQGVSLSDSGTIIAIGSHRNNGDNGKLRSSGSVRMYEYDTTTNGWTRISQDIDGDSKDDWSGESVSLNGNGTMVAIGAARNDGKNLSNTNSGHVRVYRRGS